MKRGAILAAVALLMLVLLGMGGRYKEADAVSEEEAERTMNETIEELITALDTEQLQDYLDSLSEYGGISVKEKLKSVITGDFSLDYSSVFSAAFSFLFEEGRGFLPAFAVILAVTLLVGILNSVKNGFLQSTLSDIIHFTSYLSVGAVVLACLIGVLNSCFSAMDAMKRQIEIVYPILFTLMAASGGTVSVGVYRPAVAFLGGGVLTLFSDVVMPSVIVAVVLTFVSGLTEEMRCDKLAELFKSVSKWLLGLTLGLYGVFLTVQGIATAQYDGISLRTVKYILSGSVPLVGGFLSGSVELIVAGSAVIKNAVGAFAIFLLVGTVLKPLLLFAAFQLFLRLASAATQPVGGKISSFLGALARDSSYFVAALLAVAFVYFLTLLLLLCSAGGVLA